MENQIHCQLPLLLAAIRLTQNDQYDETLERIKDNLDKSYKYKFFYKKTIFFFLSGPQFSSYNARN